MIAEVLEFEFRVRVSSSSSSCEFWVGTTDTTVHGVRYRMQVGECFIFFVGFLELHAFCAEA